MDRTGCLRARTLLVFVVGAVFGAVLMGALLEPTRLHRVGAATAGQFRRRLAPLVPAVANRAHAAEGSYAPPFVAPGGQSQALPPPPTGSVQNTFLETF